MELVLAFKVSSEVYDTDGNQRCDKMSALHDGDFRSKRSKHRGAKKEQQRAAFVISGKTLSGLSESDKKHKRQRTRVAAEDLKDWQKLLC